MTNIKNYKVDIIKRTREILVEFYPFFIEKDREVTFLMNCLLGIVIAISENEKKHRTLFKGNIDEDFIRKMPQKIGFVEFNSINTDLTVENVTNINFQVRHRSDLIGKDKFWLINKIRNCIAHQNIEEINDGGKWVGVKLWNMSNYKKDFEVVFTIDELKAFAIDLAEKYLESSK